MELKLSDVIGVGIASLLLFPMVFFAVLLGSGTAHLEFGENPELKARLAGFLERTNPEQERRDMEQNQLFQANMRLADSLERAREKIREEIARLEAVRAETARLQESIAAERKKIEELVGQSKTLSDQKIEELAQVYGAMKPVEAAPILLSLDDESIARIIKRVPEVRAQAKLMAAIGAMDNQRAAKITKILGWKRQGL